MENNNTTPAAAPAAPAPAPAAAPAPAPAAPAEPNQAAPAVQPISSKGTKTIIIVVVCTLIVAALVTCGIIFIPMIFGINWEDSYDKAKEFNSAFDKVDTECDKLSIYITSTTKSEKDYETYANACTEKINAYEEKVKALGETSAVKRDKDVKEKWEAFNSTHEKAKPVYEKLPNLMKAVHSYYVGAKEIQSSRDLDSISDEDIEKVFKPIKETGEEALIEFSNTYEEALKNYIHAAKDYQEKRKRWYATSYSDANYKTYKQEYDDAYTAYREANQAMSDIDVSEMLDFEKIFGTSEAELDKYSDNAKDLYKEIRNKYNDNKD